MVVLVLLALVALVAVIFTLPYDRLLTVEVHKVYSEQEQLFVPVIAALRSDIGENEAGFQCSGLHASYLWVRAECEYDRFYHFPQKVLTPAESQAYPAHAQKLDELLAAEGWVNDRPQDKFATVAAINPYSEQNGGVGGELAYHKNIGSISCNLRMSYSGITGASDPKGILSVDQFSCAKNITYPLLRVHQDSY